MSTITEDLLNQLKKASDISEFLDKNENMFIKETTASFLNYILETKQLSVSQIAKNSGVGEYTYKIFNGERKPSRNVIIAIALGAKISFEETQLLLRISKYAILDSRDKRDSIIIYALMNNLSVFETDDLLMENNIMTVN